MELIVEKIFERAQKHPEIIPDLKKLMNYYLPMTVKLLDAYEEMDQQPVQGENIQASKKEIEDTLDTLIRHLKNFWILSFRILRGMFQVIFQCFIRCLHRKV